MLDHYPKYMVISWGRCPIVIMSMCLGRTEEQWREAGNKYVGTFVPWVFLFMKSSLRQHTCKRWEVLWMESWVWYSCLQNACGI